MNTQQANATPRREFLKSTAGAAAGLALAGVAIPRVHAAEANTIRLALIGCGGRGTGLLRDAGGLAGVVHGTDRLIAIVGGGLGAERIIGGILRGL